MDTKTPKTIYKVYKQDRISYTNSMWTEDVGYFESRESAEACRNAVLEDIMARWRGYTESYQKFNLVETHKSKYGIYVRGLQLWTDINGKEHREWKHGHYYQIEEVTLKP